ncbi:uncharacterized protein LOC129767139 [Toxorhynchites rutilus septentrionalis]|uniref:uncharacterized protein LOC129767139 n=1 Tax=Toxorhynchites rutilus septentrionalis TaxID=329112 RepID=UPI002478868A|nr:uncharacterized protein LOC129767139 [Toxorhynchites rutilus septentrionalis]
MTLVPKAKRKKFDPKSEKGIFVGYCEDTKGYRVYDSEKGSFRISRDVVVLEEAVVICEVEQPVKPVEFMELCWDEFRDHPACGTVEPVTGAGVVCGNRDDIEPAEEAIGVDSSFSEADDYEDAVADPTATK